MLFWVSESFWSVPDGEFVLDGADECWYCWYNRQIIPEHRQNFWLPFVSSDIRYRPSTITYVSTKITGGSDAKALPELRPKMDSPKPKVAPITGISI